MESIGELDEDLLDKVEDLMFVFDNLADVDDRSIQSLLHEVSSDVLVLALKRADDVIKIKSLEICLSVHQSSCRMT